MVFPRASHVTANTSPTWISSLFPIHPTSLLLIVPGAIYRNPQLSLQVLYPLVRILFSSCRLIFSTTRIHHQVQSKISVLFPLQVQSTISVSYPLVRIPFVSCRLSFST